MEQVIIGGVDNPLHDTNTEYTVLMGGRAWNSTLDVRSSVVSAPGNIRNLRIVLDAAPGIGKSFAFTLMLNGSPSALTTTVSDAATSNSDTSNEVAVVGGDVVALRCIPSGTPATPDAFWTTVFDSTTSAESLILGIGASTLDVTATEYNHPAGGSAWTSTQDDKRQLIAAPGTISHLYVNLDIDPGTSPDAYRFTLMINGAATSLTATITANDTTGNDTAHTVTVAAGDYATIRVEPLNTPSATPRAGYGFKFTADTDGESLVLAGSNNALPQVTTEYNVPISQNDSWTATENDRRQLAQACTLKDLYILLDGSPGAGNSYAFTLRQNGAGSALTVTVSGAATTGNDTANDISISNDDLLGLQVVPTSSPTVRDAYWGMVCFIEPSLTISNAGAIASAEVFGAAVLAGPITVNGIASAEAFGTAQLNLTISPAAIASAEAFGTATLTITISPAGIASDEAFGTAILAGPISPAGIASAEAFGTPAIARVAAIEAIVRIAFDSDAFAPTPTWTDVSNDVLFLSIKKGRKQVLDRMEAGTAEIVLKNSSGNYWPDNSSGSYFPNIKPVKRINIRASFDEITYDLFTGFIESWTPTWRAGVKYGPIMRVFASDLIKPLTQFAINSAGYAEELSGTRVDNVLDDLGWPSGDRDIDNGQTTLQATGAISNLKGQSHLLKVQETEAGIVFVAGDGIVHFQDRHARFNSPFTVSQATFDDTPGNELYQGLELSLDDKLLFTEVRATRIGGSEQVASVETTGSGWAIGTAGKSELGMTTILASSPGPRSLILTGLLMTTDGNALSLAEYYLSIFKDAVLRAKTLTIMPDREPASLYPIILDYDISTRITLILAQASINKDYHIEGITHRFDAENRRWETRWELSDADSQSYWALGIAGLSELGETTRLIF